MKNVLAAIDAGFDQSVQQVREFLRQPSISGTGVGVNRTAHLVATRLRDLGFKVAIYPTSGNPIILAEHLKAGDTTPTLLIHTSFDVMTTDGETWWSVPPFAGALLDHPRFGPSLVARGAFAQKTPLMVLLLTLQAIKSAGEALPLNLLVLVDSEEESGSPSLPGFVKEHRRELARADAVYYPLFSTDRRGTARIFLGCKGIAFLRLRCQGPSTRDLHSAEVGWIRNPAHILAKALSSLVDIHGRPLMPGLLDEVRPPSEADERLLRQLAESFDPGIEALQLDATNLGIEADSKEEMLRRYLFLPTVNISGIQSGYVGEAVKTILPRQATAHVDIRLTPDELPRNVVQAVKNHLAEQGLADLVAVELVCMLDWAKSSEDTAVTKALLKSYYDAGVDSVEIWPMLPASVPVAAYANPPLKLPFVIGGLGHGGHAHGQDEYVLVASIRSFQKGFAHFIDEFSRTQPGAGGGRA
jgi:acetylornithine deacetylase/succinyl-diaminopimelate desuccinylase-like protein